MSRRPLPQMDSKRTEFGFARTTCACADCTRFCGTMPGYLIPSDLQRMRQLAGEQDLSAWAEAHLLASPGALVVCGGKPIRIRTLVPSWREDGACIFFTDDERCSIHAAAPFGCAFFDEHLPAHEADRRSSLGLQSVLEAWASDDLYCRIWQRLYAQGLRALAPEKARGQLDQDDIAPAIADVNAPAEKQDSAADLAELLRRCRLAEINADSTDRPALEARYGQVWDTKQLSEDFEVLGFQAPYVVVRRHADGVIGSLEFQNSPRFYFLFKPER